MSPKKNNDNIIAFLKKERANKYDDIEKNILNELYKICINTIKIINESNKTEYIYEVPSFIPDYPLYNIEDISIKLNKILKKKGFSTTYIPINKIYIKW